MARTSSKDKPPGAGNGELVHVQVWPIGAIRPAPENDDIYRAISLDDVADLMRSIREHGVQEPLLVSSDGFIISGHRRWKAANFIDLAEVPVRVHPVSRQENPAEFLKLLVECNNQRIKGADVLLAESVIKVDPVAAHEKIVSEREAKEARRSNDCTLSLIETHGNKRRCDFSPAKKPLLDAILRIVEEQREFWPLSVRQIHYRLLGENAPLIHALETGFAAIGTIATATVPRWTWRPGRASKASSPGKRSPMRRGRLTATGPFTI